MKIIRSFALGTIASALIAVGSATYAAPLPNGTKLTITPGVVSGGTRVSGSYFTHPGIGLDVPLQPGTDGGIIIGKNQKSGGQEKVVIDTPGELTAAFGLVGFSTFATAPLIGSTGMMAPTDASLNRFDDASCSGAGCIGKTALGTWNLAMNGYVATSFGSYYPCTADLCTPDVLAGKGIKNWVVNPDNTYSLDYLWDAEGSWASVPLNMHLEGQIILPPNYCPVVEYAWLSPTNPILFIFGKNLTGVTEVVINGVTISNFQEANSTLFFALVPGMSPPWTVKVTTSTGCSDTYPKSCP